MTTHVVEPHGRLRGTPGLAKSANFGTGQGNPPCCRTCCAWRAYVPAHVAFTLYSELHYGDAAFILGKAEYYGFAAALHLAHRNSVPAAHPADAFNAYINCDFIMVLNVVRALHDGPCIATANMRPAHGSNCSRQRCCVYLRRLSHSLATFSSCRAAVRPEASRAALKAVQSIVPR